MPSNPDETMPSEQAELQEATAIPAQRLSVIGIGASAGGLAALRAFFSALPEHNGLAFVVIVHLSPEHESILASLLQPYTTMPVMQVTEPVEMQAEHVYVIPPAKKMVVSGNSLELVEFDEPAGARRTHLMQIDAFFRSLAENHGDGGAVILSGSGSDGAVGIQAIKEKGGLLLAQLPEEAEYDGMPRSAIATGLVDIVAPVAELATQLVAAKQMRDTLQLPVDGEPLSEPMQQTLTQILAQLRVRTGHDFNGYKQATLLRRLSRRMQITQVTTLTAYLQRLRQDSAEAELLFRDLLINVTEFFRDHEAWAALETNIVPQLFAGKGRDDNVRVWTVGCATGEEAYSIAMLLLEAVSELVAPPTIQIFASDLGQAALDFAREGVYPSAIADDISASRLARFFTQENSHYRVRPELRETILFTQHNLLQDPPFSRLDLLICRNLLIYIQRELQEKVFETFYYALRGDAKQRGFLFLGNAESAEGSTDLFDTLDKRHRLYQRRVREHTLPILPSLPLLPHAVRLPALETDAPRPLQLSPGAEHQRLLEVNAPPSLLVDRDYNVLHLSERVGRYLLPPGGQPTTELLKLVRQELQPELRTALARAFEENKAISTRPIPVRFNGAPHPVYLMVRPYQPGEGAPQALVFFWEDETPVTVDPDAVISGNLNDTARKQLEGELRHVQNRLQSMREEYETTVEELRAANEELQSTNEEYKSTLEELETSKEELQSINEELQTINQELKTKIDEVTHAHSDVQNLFIATEIATLFLDRDLRVKRYTPAAAELFNLMPPDRGRPIAHLRSNLLYNELESDAQRVLAHLIPVEREAQSQGGRWFLVRVRPYRTLEDKIDGVVITFVDITANKAIEAELYKAKEYAESIVHTIPDALLVLDPALRVQMANDAFYETFQVKRETTEGRLVYELGNGQWNIPALRTLLEDILPDNKVFLGYEVEHTFEQLGRRVMLVNGRRLDHVQLILLAITDITERKQHERWQEFLLHLSDALRSLADAVAIQATVTRTVMEYFGADRCYYCEIEDNQAIIRRDAAREDLPSVVGVYPLVDFPLFSAMMNQGGPLVVQDTKHTDALDETLRELCLQMKINAFINVPVIKDHHYAGNLCLTQSARRQWTDFEVRLLQEIAERTWVAVERSRAEEALHKSEEKYGTLFNSIDEGFCLFELLYDETGKAVDYQFLEVNRVFEQQTGLANALGKLGSELAPNMENYWLEVYDQVVRTGEPTRFENYHTATGRWYEAYASRMGNVGDHHVCTVFSDITERKRREANLAFLAELSVEFAPYMRVEEITALLCEKLSRYLDLSRCDFSIVDEAVGIITTLYDWRRDADAPSVMGEHAISTFLTPEARRHYVAGNMAVISDTHQDPMISAPPEMMDALRIRAVVDSPYLESGQWKFLVSVCRSEVTAWRADEIDLIREVTARVYIRIERARAEEALRESEERQAFLLRLSDVLRPLTDPLEMQEQSARMLGQTLGANRVGYAEDQGDDDTVVVTRNYVHDVPSIEGRYHYANYGPALLRQVQAGRSAIYPDVANDPNLTDVEKASYAVLQIGSTVNIPLMKAGRLVAILFVHCKAAHTWRATDLELMQETADRTWSAVERARAEEQLRQREAELARVQRIGGVGGLAIDVTGGLTGRRSPEYLRLHGLTAASVNETHEDWLQRVHPDDRAQADRILGEALAGTGSRYENEYRIIRPSDGQVRWIAAVAAIERDRQGQPLHLVGAHIDITERKRAEEALRTSEGQLRSLIENLPGGAVFIFDPDLRYLLAEGEALRVAGLQSEELVGKTVFEALTSGLAVSYEPQLRQALTGVPFLHEHDAHGRSYITRGTPLRATNGDIYAVLAVSYDISDRKRAEHALQELNDSLEQEVNTRTTQVRELASTLTLAEQRERRRLSQLLHDDLQQLLYGVQMRIVSIVQDIDGKVPASVLRHVEETDSWLTQAIQMVRQLTVDLSPPVLKGEGLMDALRWLVRQMLEVNGLHVELYAQHAFRLPSEDMRVLLFQIVRELLFNVVKHSGTDHAKVELLDGMPGILRIIISDKGRGFDSGSLSPKQDGGFGLFSIRERLDLFSGRMEIQSAPGQGTRITLTVPVGMSS
ncbi:MAG: CheR family methyltransferase [Caldilineaceae bacterium]